MKSWPASKVVSMRVESLVPYARNARTHSDQQVAQIAASIKEWGWTNPVLVDDSNGVIAGHGRILAAQKIGLEQVPVMVAEGWTDQQKRAYVIADNKLALNADWDYDVLPLELSELKDMGADLNLIGFDDAELDSILNQDGVTDGLTDPDETPDIEDDAVSKEGDIWLMGKHRLICGDSTNEKIVDSLLSGVEPHLMVTDPPYGVDLLGGKNGTIGGSVKVKSKTYEPIIGDDKPFDPSQILRSSKKSVIFGANYFSHFLPLDGRWIVWDKGRPEGTTFSDAELAWTSGEGIKIKIYRCVWNGMVREGESGERLHPTQKPVKLFAEIISDFIEPLDCVYDPYLGAGTTIIAAEQTGRFCYAIEFSPNYVDIAVRRWQNFTGKSAILESTGEEFGQ